MCLKHKRSEVWLEKTYPFFPAEEGDDLNIVFVVESIYDDVGVPVKMKRCYIKPGSQKERGPSAQ
jgi:hypothetical protein